MCELGGNGGFQPDFRRHGKPGSIPLRQQCMKLRVTLKAEWRPQKTRDAINNDNYVSLTISSKLVTVIQGKPNINK